MKPASALLAAISAKGNDALHTHKIPCFLLESILSDILHQVEAGARAEKEDAARKYEQQLAEAKENPLVKSENDESSRKGDTDGNST